MSKTIFNKIHNISPQFNKIFSGPLFVFSCFVVALMMVLPYRGRIVLALLINVFFNRPIIYLNYFARYLAKPFVVIHLGVFYFLIIGVHAFILVIFGKSMRGWSKSPPSTSIEDAKYQS